jgi:hypothetical protein
VIARGDQAQAADQNQAVLTGEGQRRAMGLLLGEAADLVIQGVIHGHFTLDGDGQSAGLPKPDVASLILDSDVARSAKIWTPPIVHKFTIWIRSCDNLATGQVTYSPPGASVKFWPHAVDFLADWVQHIPRVKQHTVTYAGWFTHALGKLNPKPEMAAKLELPKPVKPTWVKWRGLVLRRWAVDPELCPKCTTEMKRVRGHLQNHEFQSLLKRLGIGDTPTRQSPTSRFAATKPGGQFKTDGVLQLPSVLFHRCSDESRSRRAVLAVRPKRQPSSWHK